MSCVKTLCQCVLEGHFTRETLRKVMKYEHDPWEHELNQFIRKNALHWDKVQEHALTMAMEHLQSNKDEGLRTLVNKHHERKI